MNARHVRRIVLDLTPMIDVVTLLLFGVMIHSTLVGEADADRAERTVAAAERRLEAERRALGAAGDRADELFEHNAQLREQLAEAQKDLERTTEERRLLAEQLRGEKQDLARALGGILQLTEAEQEAFEKPFEKLSRPGALRLAKVLEELRDERNPVAIYKAMRRLVEMEKVFTFVDVHVNADDMLALTVDGRAVASFLARKRTPVELENAVRQELEKITFNSVVLLTFSYEGEARDATVEATESAIGALLAYYRGKQAGQGQQFRYGRVGLVDAVPARAPASP